MANKVIAWPFWVGGVLLALFVAVFYYPDYRKHECEGCHSQLVRKQAWFGIWTVFAFPISPVSEEESPSNLYLDYLVAGHTHEWRFVNGGPRGVFQGGCAVGGHKRTGNLAYLYEKEPTFRDFVHKKQADGSLNTKDFVAACLLPEPEQYLPDRPYPNGYITREAAIERESSEVQRLRRFAIALEKEFSPR